MYTPRPWGYDPMVEVDPMVDPMVEVYVYRVDVYSIHLDHGVNHGVMTSTMGSPWGHGRVVEVGPQWGRFQHSLFTHKVQ